MATWPLDELNVGKLKAYAYPHQMRATRDLLRRRIYLMHHRAEALAHIVNTASQYNLSLIHI